MSRLPEAQFPYRSEYRGISGAEAWRRTYRAGTALMRKYRDSDGALKVGNEFVSFPLPVMGYPGRINSLISLSTQGCSIAAAGGCSFCDYAKSKFAPAVVRDSLPAQIAKAFDVIRRENAGYDKALINLTGIGSMFDTHEIPLSALNLVLDNIVSMMESGKWDRFEWTTESRLEFVTEKTLGHIGDYLKSKKSPRYPEGIMVGTDLVIDIGYGVESLDPLISKAVLLKLFKDEKYVEKIDLLRQFDFKPTAHTLFKPAFLTEAEAIADTVATVRRSFDLNLSDTMIVMTMNVRQATLIGAMERAGYYALPSVWSVAKVMADLGPEASRRCHFFGFSVATDAARTVQPHDLDEERMMALIKSFSGEPSEWQAIVTLLNRTDSPSKRQWSKLLHTPPPHTLAERIASGYARMAEIEFGALATKRFPELYQTATPQPQAWSRRLQEPEAPAPSSKIAKSSRSTITAILPKALLLTAALYRPRRGP